METNVTNSLLPAAMGFIAVVSSIKSFGFIRSMTYEVKFWWIRFLTNMVLATIGCLFIHVCITEPTNVSVLYAKTIATYGENAMMWVLAAAALIGLIQLVTVHHPFDIKDTDGEAAK